MFESLRKKISGWLGKAKEKPKKEKKAKKKAEKPAKARKEKKEKAPKIKRTKQELEEERKVSDEIIEDIKKERGEEIKSIPQLEPQSQEAESPSEHQIADNEPIEKPIEELKEELEPEEKQGFFARLKQKLTSSKLTQEQFDELFYEFELALLENNVALEVVDKIKSELSKDLVGISVKKSEIEKTILESLKSSILSVLIEPPDLIKAIQKSLEPYVILFFGINGTGKTTSIAKLAHLLKKNNISCVLAAADTFRAASIEQLQVHAKKLNVPIISSTYGADPASIAFDAIAYAKSRKIQCVLIDTAGRMYTKANLLKEMEKIIRIAKPNLKLFVGESITGNDAVEQAKTFNESAGIDGIILTKSDIDDKGGAILSVSYVTKKPIYFLGTGQNYDDLQIFKKSTVLKNLGIG